MATSADAYSTAASGTNEHPYSTYSFIFVSALYNPPLTQPQMWLGPFPTSQPLVKPISPMGIITICPSPPLSRLMRKKCCFFQYQGHYRALLVSMRSWKRLCKDCHPIVIAEILYNKCQKCQLVYITPQRRPDLCIPRNKTARSRSQFLGLVCLFFQQNRWTDPGYI